MRSNTKIIHVQLREAYEDKTNYYFGSKAAIYAKLPKEAIGIAYSSLRNINLAEGPYINDRCVIRQDVIYTKERGE